ncbi:MAG: hypothetical protein QOC73_25 [Actinomycetota bacterium]|nr:hypothetical protein [Actinomycetota bacterium]
MSGSHIVVDYEELQRMSSVWAEAAHTIARLGFGVAELAVSHELVVNAVFDPAGAARAESAILEAALGPAGLVALAARMATDSLLLTAVVEKERLVDDFPLHQVMDVEKWFATLPVAFAISPRRTLVDGGRRFAALGDALPGYLSPFAEPLLEAFAPSPAFRRDVALRRPVSVDPVFGLPVRSLIASSDAHPGGVSISRYSPEWIYQPPVSMAAMLDRVADLENFEGALIAVQRVVGSDGVARFLVVLPGLRHFAPSRDPQDLLGAAVAEAGTSTGYTRCVRLALDAAQVPRGAEVVLAGHSQGGIVAMDLAGDPGFNGGRVRVAQVIAAGSPISSKAVAPGTGTRVFSVENVNDVVTHLDAVESPTVHQSVEKLTYRFAIDEHDPGRTHDVSLYAQQLRRLADSPNPLLARDNADLQPYLSGSVTTTVFEVRDEPAR